jgi:hypothetical protein
VPDQPSDGAPKVRQEFFYSPDGEFEGFNGILKDSNIEQIATEIEKILKGQRFVVVRYQSLDTFPKVTTNYHWNGEHPLGYVRVNDRAESSGGQNTGKELMLYGYTFFTEEANLEFPYATLCYIDSIDKCIGFHSFQIKGMGAKENTTFAVVPSEVEA